MTERWRCAAVVEVFQGYVETVSWNSNGPLEFVTISSDKSVRVWRIAPSVDEKESHGQQQISVHLVWGSNLRKLCVQGLKFKDVVGLSPHYEELLLQRGAAETT
jgi:WD40 repeat protein